jgi:uncharacterized protein (DUF305 family)
MLTERNPAHNLLSHARPQSRSRKLNVHHRRFFMRSTRCLILFAFVVVALAGFSLGCADQVTAPETRLVPAAKPVDSGGSAGNFERRYLSNAIDAEELILEMAQICVQKESLHAELMTFCQETATQASHDLTLMQSWLSAWYDIDHSPSLRGPDQRLLSELGSLEGADFEAAYLEAMVKEYTTSVRVEQHCYARASTTALIDFCFNMQLAQSNDIDQMKSWLCNWHGVCR